VAVCRACGFDNQRGLNFCGQCGTQLAEARSPEARERKNVTVLFCDLVGFTAAADGADPEEVQARLSPYHARSRREIERFGGTVEKFIGDAVMAAFGAPAVHEDDPERAVRAGLALLDTVGQLNEEQGLGLAVRIGINTGTAVVTTSARPELGDGMVTGDVVNTAARLQTAAEPGSVVVGAATWRATRHVIDYKELPAVKVKGKSQTVSLWQALGARSRIGEPVADTRLPLVGRMDELEILQRTFARCARERSAQLVTLVGEPGIGKSRLVQEFFEWIDDRDELVTWRQGRCMAYGSSPLGPLAQVVKAHAGVLDTDDQDSVAARLRESVQLVVGDTVSVKGGGNGQVDWVVSRLGPLLGLAGGEPSPEEAFAAAQAYLEGIASDSPLVVVIEDLHWAEKVMLDFVDHLAEWASGVPMMLVATARPELYDAAPAWGGGRPNVATIGLSPLTDGQTAQLVAAVLDGAALPSSVHGQLLERAGGNPLYAQEFVRMIEDRGPGSADGEPAGGFPQSVQAVIAARLDTLQPESKAVLQAAAVVGQTFWAGAAGAVAGVADDAHVGQILRDLVRREYLRRSRTSTFAAQDEHSFVHALIRDVAYEQIPRADRPARHQAAAEWLVGAVGDNPGEHAAAIASHYDQARNVAAAGSRPDDTDAEALAGKSRRWHVVAAELALPVDPVAAEAHIRSGLDVAPAGGSDRPDLLILLAEAMAGQLRAAEAEAAYAEAGELLRSSGAESAAATIAPRHAQMLFRMGRRDEGLALLDRTIATLEAAPAGRALADAYSMHANIDMASGHYDVAIRWADKALAVAEALEPSRELVRVAVRALSARASSRAALGREGANQDWERGLSLALDNSLTDLSLELHNNAAIRLMDGSAAAGVTSFSEAADLARSRGRHALATGFIGLNTAYALRAAGRLDEALSTALRAVDALESVGALFALVHTRTAAASILLDLGRYDEADAMLDDIPRVAEADVPANLATQLMVRHGCARGRGAEDQARINESRLVELFRQNGAGALPEDEDEVAIGEILMAGGAGDALDLLVAEHRRGRPRRDGNAVNLEAVACETRRDHDAAQALYVDAAQRWEQYGNPSAAARALIGAARCALVGGESADELIMRATAILEDIGHKQLLATAAELA
jgi:class 3 adenylate cyclase/tetratricopeptide (TPR) repeat protein